MASSRRAARGDAKFEATIAMIPPPNFALFAVVRLLRGARRRTATKLRAPREERPRFHRKAEKAEEPEEGFFFETAFCGAETVFRGRQREPTSLFPSPPRPPSCEISAEKNRANAVRLFEMIERGAITPKVDGVYPFAEAGEALARMERREVVGKLVLKP